MSAVIGASDLVDTSVASLGNGGNQFNRALQLGVEVAENEANVPVGGFPRALAAATPLLVLLMVLRVDPLSDRIGLRQGLRCWSLTPAQLRV